MGPFTFEPLSEDALLVRFGAGIDLATNAQVHAAAGALRTAQVPGIVDIAPAYASLLVRFDPLRWVAGAGEPASVRIIAALDAALSVTAFEPRAARKAGAAPAADAAGPIEVPVCYGDAFGPDLTAVAANAGIAPEEVIARHAAATYTVAMIGFAPGFPYLLGLDPLLHTPRRTDPRTRVPAGSVAIGGAQTGIYPRLLPGGWQLIGRTPLVLFLPDRDPPALLSPGNAVRFRPVGADEFRRIAAARPGATPASGHANEG